MSFPDHPASLSESTTANPELLSIHLEVAEAAGQLAVALERFRQAWGLLQPEGDQIFDISALAGALSPQRPAQNRGRKQNMERIELPPGEVQLRLGEDSLLLGDNPDTAVIFHISARDRAVLNAAKAMEGWFTFGDIWRDLQQRESLPDEARATYGAVFSQFRARWSELVNRDLFEIGGDSKRNRSYRLADGFTWAAVASPHSEAPPAPTRAADEAAKKDTLGAKSSPGTDGRPDPTVPAAQKAEARTENSGIAATPKKGSASKPVPTNAPSGGDVFSRLFNESSTSAASTLYTAGAVVEYLDANKPGHGVTEERVIAAIGELGNSIRKVDTRAGPALRPGAMYLVLEHISKEDARDPSTDDS